MGESFPDGSQDGQEFRANNGEQHIEVTDDQAPGEQTEGPTDTPAETEGQAAGIDDNEGRVQDVDKAWEMAHSAKVERDDAADARAQVALREAVVQDVVAHEAAHKARGKEADAEVSSMFRDPETPITETHQRAEELGQEVRAQRESELAELRERAAGIKEYDGDQSYSGRTGSVNRLKSYLENPGVYSLHERHSPNTSDFDIGNRRLGERATEQDGLADKIEAWAEYLHDHPVGEKYKETHEGVDFSPNNLARVEIQTDRLNDLLDRFEEEILGKLHARDGISGMGYAFARGEGNFHLYDAEKLFDNDGDQDEDYVDKFLPHKVFDEAYGFYSHRKAGENADEHREKSQRWQELKNNPDTTLGQIKDAYIEAVRDVYVTPKRSMNNMLRSILADIKSGRAAE